VKTVRRPAAPAGGIVVRPLPLRLSSRAAAFLGRRIGVTLFGVCVLLCAACASSRGGGAPAGRIGRSENFPLDPREELAGPFPDGVDSGWAALVAGDAAAAEKEFSRARAGRPNRAAEIGLIESRVVRGRTAEALSGCTDALAGGPPTVPLLVACGEARARTGQVFEAHELYARAAARSHGRSAIRKRADELKAEAVDELRKSASSGAKDQNFPDARGRIDRAIEMDPGEAGLHALAGEIELSAGNHDRAFERFREAYRLDPKNVAVQEKLAELAIEKDPALAVSVLDSLARHEPRYRERAAEARLAFRVSNWPAPERDAAGSERLTRAGAATLVWWMFPEIREAKVTTSVIASDAVSRRDTRSILRAVSLGLLDVDRETHRARPDGGLTRRAGARMLLRLLRIVNPGVRPRCLEGSPESGRSGVEAVRAAVACGLLEEKDGSWVPGREFTRGLDRVRMMATGKGDLE
jgi:tetratricopeptide (TPR) repeat protein